MDYSLKDAIPYLNYLWLKRKTKHGLCLILSTFLLGYFLKIPPLNNITSLFVALLFFVFWLFDSGQLILPSKKITIAFSLKAIKPESQIIIDETLIKLEEKLKLLGTGSKFRLLQIGSDMFPSHKHAENYCKKKKLILAIHGNIWSGKEDAQYVFDLNNFFFSYSVSIIYNQKIINEIAADIALILGNRDWRIEEIKYLTDIEKVSNNLVESILSIVGIAFSHSETHAPLSIDLIERLLPYSTKRLKPKEKEIEIKGEEVVKISMNLLRSGRLRSVLDKCYLLVGYGHLINKEYDFSYKHFKKSLDLGINPIDSLSGLAMTSFHLGKIDQAISFSEEINKHSKNNLVYFVDMAFLKIMKKDYNAALSFYENARKYFKRTNKNDVAIINDVIQFLDSRIKDLPKEYALVFAKDLLTYNFLDKNAGKVILDNFHKKSLGSLEYKTLAALSEKILRIS